MKIAFTHGYLAAWNRPKRPSQIGSLYFFVVSLQFLHFVLICSAARHCSVIIKRPPNFSLESTLDWELLSYQRKAVVKKCVTCMYHYQLSCPTSIFSALAHVCKIISCQLRRSSGTKNNKGDSEFWLVLIVNRECLILLFTYTRYLILKWT